MKWFLMFLTVLAVIALPAIADTVIPGPHELPDPDTTPPDTTKPVKVFILSGQSNMVGMGKISPLGTAGTLETITKTDGMFPHLIDAAGNWTVRNDVMYRGVVTAIGNGQLTPGVMGANIGPEMGFGHIMGYYFDEPVLVLKSSQGNRSISWDFAPPSTERFDYNGNTYAGYGDSPNSWPIGTTPTPIGWYAGKQYDDCFLDEADWAPIATTLGMGPITNVTDVLDNFATQYPQYAAQGFQIAGFAWWQGHKDQNEPHASRYEQNMVRFIKDIRKYYEKRYPGQIISDAPFVLATVAFDGGWDNTKPEVVAIANGQLAVSGETGNYPEFEGNVKTVEARGFWRDSSISPTTAGYHYNGNAETYMLVGDALGRAMIELQPAFDVNAGNDMITWSGEPVDLDATVQEGVTAASYAWTAIADAGITVDFSDPASEDPTVTITKPAGDMARVILKLTVNDGVNNPVSSTVVIDVYDDACKATRVGLGIAGKYELSGDCITNLADIAAMATTWLKDNSLAAPVAK